MRNIDLLNELSDHVTVKINSCREQFHDLTWLERKVHNDYDIWLILEGQVLIETDGSRSSAGEGDIVFFYPGMLYSAYAGHKGCRFLYIHFDFSIGNNFRIINDFDFAGIISGELVEEEARLFKDNWRGCTQSSASSLLLKGYFTVLLSKLLEVCCSENKRKCSFPRIHGHKHKDRLAVLQPVFKYIEKNLSGKIKVSELSPITCMSEKYFIHYFKAAIGISPLAYITQLRMNQARNYLYQGGYSVKQIASLLGYSDPYTFSKAFKKHYNVSPSNFV